MTVSDIRDGDDHDISSKGKISHIAGVFVFVVASAIGLSFLFWASLDGVEPWVRLRSLELFSMVAAVGIVVAIISISKNPFVMTFGILLIGALIVPTKDMVYLALLASGRSLTEEIGSAGVQDGSEFRARESDVASKIVARLERTSSA